MPETIKIILYTTLSGACIPLGAWLAKIESFRSLWLEKEFRHWVIAFGGGILVSAVVFVLVPKGILEIRSPLLGSLIFMMGGGCFFILEQILGAKKQEKPQLSAMLLDYIPESMALGGLMASGSLSGTSSGLLLAIFIGLQNIPEGFNAYRELISKSKAPSSQIFFLMLAFIPLGPIFGLFGWFFLSNYPVLLGALMLFSSGGILYLIFQDIAPQAHLKCHWGPPLGAVIGFGLAMFASLSLGH